MWCKGLARGWTQTTTHESRARSSHYGEGLGPVGNGGVQIAPVFSAQDSNQDGWYQYLRGLQKHCTQNTW